MRGDITYHVYGVHAGRGEDTYLGAFRTVCDADAEVKRLKALEMKGRNWADQHHNKGFVIRKVVVETDFEVPSRPAPRDKYFVKTSVKPSDPKHGKRRSSTYFADTPVSEKPRRFADMSATTPCSTLSSPSDKEPVSWL